MSGQKSNLSASKYGYDLVVATTQDSINATMKEFLSSLDSQDFNACYQWDDNNNCVPLDFQQVLTATGGTDPFTIPDKSNTDPKVKALDDLGFAFAFRATIGVSEGVAPTAIPDIVKLDRGNAFVTYQLFCATFDILVLDEHHRGLDWTSLSQPDDNPWLFKFNVNLDMRTGDRNAFNNLPISVQNKVKNLNPDSAFSVQQLYLDLNTAGLQDVPEIEGLDKSSEAYPILMRVFTDTYWANAKKSGGGPILGYTVQPVTPNPLQPSIIPTDLNIEVSPNLDAQGNATTQYGLYTLNYLVMSKAHPMPAPVQFEWNWIEDAEKLDENGVLAINRDTFVDYLKGLVNQGVGTLSIDTLADLRHSGDDYTITYSYKQADSPASFAPVSTPSPRFDGFSTVLTMSYQHQSHDDSEASDHLSSIHGDFNYQIDGDVAFKDNLISLTLHAIAYIKFNVHEAGIDYTHLDGNYFDLAQRVTYTLNVTDQGQLAVTRADTSNDASESFDWHKGGILDLGQMGGLEDSLNKIKDSVGTAVRNAFKNYEDGLTNLISNSHAWVFPGGKTFSYKNVYFSDHQDLVTHVVYVEPS